jgi:hypothetical protein
VRNKENIKEKEILKMKKYKGYYIDHIYFNSKEEIDEFIKSEAVNAYRKSVEYFANHPSMEASSYSSDKADRLVNEFGFSWEEVEAIEIKTLEAIA